MEMFRPNYSGTKTNNIYIFINQISKNYKWGVKNQVQF